MLTTRRRQAQAHTSVARVWEDPSPRISSGAAYLRVQALVHSVVNPLGTSSRILARPKSHRTASPASLTSVFSCMNMSVRRVGDLGLHSPALYPRDRPTATVREDMQGLGRCPTPSEEISRQKLEYASRLTSFNLTVSSARLALK